MFLSLPGQEPYCKMGTIIIQIVYSGLKFYICISTNYMIPVVQQIASEYKSKLQSLYGKDFEELILFGSHARGDFHEESDLDFAVLLRHPEIRVA